MVTWSCASSSRQAMTIPDTNRMKNARRTGGIPIPPTCAIWGPKDVPHRTALLHCGEHLAEEVVQRSLLDPADDDHEVVVPVNVDDVGAVPLERDGGRRG